jgi:hypothetical protein
MFLIHIHIQHFKEGYNTMKKLRTSLVALLFAFIICPYSAIANQPEHPVPCAEGETVYLDFGEYSECSIDSVADQDSFMVSASAGDIGSLVRINVTKTGGTSYFNQRIEVWDPSGAKIVDAIDNTYTADLSIDYAGDFSIWISDDNNAATGSYAIQVERIKPVYTPVVSYDCDNIQDSIDQVPDVDFFIFNGNAGTTVRLVCTKTGGTSYFNQRIEVWDPSGAKIVDAIDNTYSEDLSLGLSGEFLIAISDDNRAAPGSYSINIQCLAGTCPPDPIEGLSVIGSCSDGTDNDCDGFTDSEDPDCEPAFGMDIKANGKDGSINVSTNETVSITVALEDGPYTGTDVDLWIGAATPWGPYWYNPVGVWTPSLNPVWYYQQLTDIPETEILNMSFDATGVYTFFIAVDIGSGDDIFNIYTRDHVNVFVTGEIPSATSSDSNLILK